MEYYETKLKTAQTVGRRLLIAAVISSIIMVVSLYRCYHNLTMADIFLFVMAFAALGTLIICAIAQTAEIQEAQQEYDRLMKAQQEYDKFKRL